MISGSEAGGFNLLAILKLGEVLIMEAKIIRDQPFVPTFVGRRADDGSGVLAVTRDPDGDYHLAIKHLENREKRPLLFFTSVEFCSLQGGGRSPRVRKALAELARAIHEENQHDPLGEYSR